MIKLEIKTIYYYKKQYHHESIKEKKAFPDIEEGIQYFKNYIPAYYINDKDFSTFEEISIYKSTEYGIKRYYKRIDPIVKTIETNYIEA